ncbi:MAG: 50S ribosomal protein L22 [Anaerolineales bacterium]
MAIDIRAHAADIPQSAQKVGLVVDLVRGKDVNEAMNILKFTPSKAAQPLSKLLASAIANAEKNVGVPRSQLYVHQIVANEAQTRKWRRFGARGRFKPWLRRASHVSLVLRQREGAEAPAPAAAAAE